MVVYVAAVYNCLRICLHRATLIINVLRYCRQVVNYIHSDLFCFTIYITIKKSFFENACLRVYTLCNSLIMNALTCRQHVDNPCHRAVYISLACLHSSFPLSLPFPSSLEFPESPLFLGGLELPVPILSGLFRICSDCR